MLIGGCRVECTHVLSVKLKSLKSSEVFCRFPDVGKKTRLVYLLILSWRARKMMCLMRLCWMTGRRLHLMMLNWRTRGLCLTVLSWRTQSWMDQHRGWSWVQWLIIMSLLMKWYCACSVTTLTRNGAHPWWSNILLVWRCWRWKWWHAYLYICRLGVEGLRLSARSLSGKGCVFFIVTTSVYVLKLTCPYPLLLSSHLSSLFACLDLSCIWSEIIGLLLAFSRWLGIGGRWRWDDDNIRQGLQMFAWRLRVAIGVGEAYGRWWASAFRHLQGWREFGVFVTIISIQGHHFGGLGWLSPWLGQRSSLTIWLLKQNHVRCIPTNNQTFYLGIILDHCAV